MARYAGNVTNELLVPLIGASIYVYAGQYPDLFLADLEDDSGTPIGNPVSSNEYGDYSFNTDDGVYRLEYWYQKRQRTILEGVQVGVGVPLPTSVVLALAASSGASLVGTTTGNVQSDLNAANAAIALRATTADLASTATGKGSEQLGHKQLWSGAITTLVSDKLRTLPHMYDLITPANRTTSYNAATALQAALDSGERFVLPMGEIRFSGTLNLTQNNGGFIGQDKGSRLVTTSATGDIFAVGDGTNEISGVRFENFTLFSTVTRTSGHAFNCVKVTDAEMLYLRVGSRDDDTAFGNRLFRGYYFDRFSDVDIYGGEIVGTDELVRLRGNADQSIGAECTLGGGLLIYKGTNQIHLGGGCGGVKLESMDASAGQVALLIDETLQTGTINREVIVSPACSFDSFTTAGIIIDQPTASAARFLFRGNWVCGGTTGAHGIWIKNAEQARVLVSSHLYGNGGDGLRIDDDQAYVVFKGEADLNTGYGVNATVTTARLTMSPSSYGLANTAGFFNKTNNPLLYTIPDGSLKLPAYTVATLPPVMAAADSIAVVTDATARTPDSIVAGGSTNRVFVKSDGTNWRIL